MDVSALWRRLWPWGRKKPSRAPVVYLCSRCRKVISDSYRVYADGRRICLPCAISL